jgi:hypothetical protein
VAVSGSWWNPTTLRQVSYRALCQNIALLAARRGGDAASEFQKILNRWGIVLDGPIGALARPQMGALAIHGERVGPKTPVAR